ncbi:hypothetical protein S40293_05357 [Stachybotrys chartarum IBT 40293]|nr:hypothetical protein S40293_05357 [Stachybotrys chartarum IBT 40293]
MSFEDDDDDLKVVAQPASAAEGEGPTAIEDAQDDEMPDFKLFASMFAKKKSVAKNIRKGEKDFESHGTRAQENTLESSRQAMEDVLSFTRVHRKDVWTRGWYFPEWLSEESVGSQQHMQLLQGRVVIMEHERGGWQKDIGQVMPGKRDRPGAGRLWLLPEEALWLVERGTLDLWWPSRDLEELLPAMRSEAIEKDRLGFGPDDYDVGLPMSLESAYATLIGEENEPGKISLPKYQTYTHLKRAGFHVLRATPATPLRNDTPSTFATLQQWLISLVSWENAPRPQPYGPLVTPGLYRAYKPIYERLAILPRHKPLVIPPADHVPQDPFRVIFHVWKSGGLPFSKSNPGPPDFRVAVAEADGSFLPTLTEVEALLESTPYDPPVKEAWRGPGRMYQRLRHGHRNVVVAVVDRGLVNFMRFGEGATIDAVMTVIYKALHDGGQKTSHRSLNNGTFRHTELQRPWPLLPSHPGSVISK